MSSYLGDWYDKTFVDWGVAGFQSKAWPDAHERYVGNLKDMVKNKNWPPALRDGLVEWSVSVVDGLSSNDADAYWSTIGANEAQKIADLGYNPATLPNYDKHLNWLATVTDAAGSYQDVLDQYSPVAVIKGTIGKTADDLNPKKSWIPWAIGGGALTFLYLVLRR